jgi:hypothetical protein
MIVRLTLITLILTAANLDTVSGVHDRTQFAGSDMARNKDDYPVRGEFHKTYSVAPNANIEVTGIEGPVDVETTNGSDVEIHFMREARSQAEYDCETLDVRPSPTNFVILHKTTMGKQCQVIAARETLKLVVPRGANLSLSKIEGDVSVGTADGFLRLKWIEGAVRIGQTRAAEIGWVEGGLFLNVAQLTSDGINVNNVEGAVELGVSDKLNADLSVTRSSGRVQIDDLRPETSTVGKNGSRLRLGTGGSGISISGIEGGVKVFLFNP